MISTGQGLQLVTGGIEVYEEDEPEIEVALAAWDWDVNDQLLDGDYGQYETQTRSSSVYSSMKILDRLRLVLQKWHFLTSKQCMLSWNTCENLQ